MKIQFVKETELNKTYYFTRVNDKFVSNSLSSDYDKAKALYDAIVELGGQNLNGEQVLEEFNIDEVPTH